MRKESLITQIANIYNCLTGLEQDRAIDKLYGEYMASMKEIAIQRYRHHDMKNQMVFQAMSASDYHFAECREWAVRLHEYGDELFQMQELEDSLDASPADCIEEEMEATEDWMEEITRVMEEESIPFASLRSLEPYLTPETYSRAVREAEKEQAEWEAKQEAAHDEFILQMHDHLH